VAEILPKDRRGQILLLLTVAAVTTGYVLWQGFAPVGIDGVTQYRLRRDSLQVRIDTLELRVRRAQAVVRTGTAQQQTERLALYRSTLELMRQLVPSSGEIPNLLDDITSRAKIRGATVAEFNPQPAEPGTPFDVMRERFTVHGRFDQVSEFLTDVASLPRIVVPFDVRLERLTGPAADTAQRVALLRASFQIRTYVKSVAAALPGATPPPATAPAPPQGGPGASAEPRRE
jgi:type IV pilus assembly protein PilO